MCGGAVCDLAPAGQLILKKDLIMGANLRRTSHAETCLKIHGNGIVTVSGRFQAFFASSIEVFEKGHLILGNGYLNTGACISCAKQITLGDGVFIARNVYITDSDHHQILDEQGRTLNEPRAVQIGDHVWIGVGAVVLKGVSIGNGAVIGAGSVVTHDVPANCLAVGVPARVIREGVCWK